MRESFETGFARASELFMNFVPRLLLAVVILAAGYFIAKAICRVLSRVLDRVGFNRLVERGGVKRALNKSGWDAGMILSKVLFYFVMLFVLQLAFGVFGPNPISAILTDIIAFLPNIFVAIVIVTLAAAFASAARQLIEVALGAFSYGRVVAAAAGAAILIVGITAALNQLQIAPAIVNGLFYAMLATIVGVTVVAVGGGGIQPMRQRWERALTRIGEEVPRLQQEVAQRAPERAERPTTEWTTQSGPTAKPIPPAADPVSPPTHQVTPPTPLSDVPTEQPRTTSRFPERRPPPGRKLRDQGDGI